MNDQHNNKSDKKAMMDEVALSAFVDKLIDERKDPNITQATRPQVKAMLLAEVNEAINTHMVNCLSEKDQLALDDLLNTNPTDEDLNKFFMETVSNVEVEIASALLNFHAAYVTPLGKAAPAAPSPLSPAPVNKNN